MRVETYKSVLGSMIDKIEIKLAISLLLSFFFNGKMEIIYTVYTLILIDTTTGLWFAIKQNEVTSRGFARAPAKCLVYFAMLIVSRGVDKTLPMPIASSVMDSFIVITESVSILENLSKLGYPIPNFLVKRLKDFYQKKE